MATKDEALKRVILQAGGAEVLAGWFGITPQAISQWKRIPVGRVAEIERRTGISRGEQRPDVFGPVPSSVSA